MLLDAEPLGLSRGLCRSGGGKSAPRCRACRETWGRPAVPREGRGGDLPPSTMVTEPGARCERLDVRALEPRPLLIINPHAGHKLGISTNTGTADAVQAAVEQAGVRFELRPTEHAGHATELARQAVAEGRRLVIAAGGDGTVEETAQALVGTGVALAVMPLGSVMNVARTLCIPHHLNGAAEVIAEGRVLAMDVGRVGHRFFIETAGVGLDAELFAAFDQLDSSGLRANLIRATVRFLRGLGTPRLDIELDGVRRQVRAPMVTVANIRFEGAADDIAPDARIDDGLLDVVVFRGIGVVRALLYLFARAYGRRVPWPHDVETLRARRVRIAPRRTRSLPVHADGTPIGTTPVAIAVVPAALRVLVGTPAAGAACAWEWSLDASTPSA